MKVVGFLPAKGTSDRIENKNTKLLDGKPLFQYALETLLKCKNIDEVVLDSDSDEILNYASYLNYIPMKRSAKLASNSTNGNQLLLNEVLFRDADIYVQILGTSPFIKQETIEAGIDFLIKNDDFDSVVLVKKEKQYLWSAASDKCEFPKPQYDSLNIPNSVNLNDTLVETMGLYIIRKSAILKTKRRVGDRPHLIYAEPIESIDVNFPEDFQLANLIAAGLREKERTFIRKLRDRLSSALLADVLYELNLNLVYSGLAPNIPGTKIFGRCKTLKLSKLNFGDDYKSIYDALKCYDTIVPGDVIVVENDAPEYAYFGELNANLAIRSGAIGAIIAGKTRDSSEVMKLGFPVFSSGTTCMDVKGHAKVESINQMIKLGNIELAPESLIYADSEGVIVIPPKYESVVLNKVVEKISTERNVLNEITKGTSAVEIVTSVGEF